jgi:hypothetical protein
LKHGKDGFADADGCLDLSGGDHVDVKWDGTDLGLRVDPIGSLEEFPCSAFVIVWDLWVSLGPGRVAEIWGRGGHSVDRHAMAVLASQLIKHMVSPYW